METTSRGSTRRGARERNRLTSARIAVGDSALLKGFAQRGLGVAVVPTSVAKEVMRQYQLGIVGRTEEVRQAVFLIRARGRRTHPLIAELEEQHRASARRGAS